MRRALITSWAVSAVAVRQANTDGKTNTQNTGKTDGKTGSQTGTQKPSNEDFSDRKGYDADFIKAPKFRITLDGLLKNHLSVLAPLTTPIGTNKFLLNYHHFSVATNRERRMPLLTAVNIDGKQAVDLQRVSDKWSYDPRLSVDFQTPPELYKKNDLDLGHLVRRLDPVWGDVAEAANFDQAF